MQTHITYNTAKKLKVFLGENAPEPMSGHYWETKTKGYKAMLWWLSEENSKYHNPKFPAYQLHDLLSKPFCEAFIKERFARGLNHEAAAWELTGYLERMINEFYSGGLPAVESALMEMMEEK